MLDRSENVSITIDGISLTVPSGQTVAQVMIRTGSMICRTQGGADARGVFCGMGICGECRMIVNGVANTRICQTFVEDGMVVQRQDDIPHRMGA